MPLPLAAAAGLAAIPGIVGGFYNYNMAGKTTAGERGLGNTIASLEDLRNLSMNPNDPRYKAMLEQETGNLRTSFLQQLNDVIEANRRQALLGRQEFFDPERRDESMFNAVSKAGREAQTQGRQNVLQRLNNAIQNLQVQQQGYGALADIQNARKQQRTNAITGGLGALGQAGTSLGKMF